MTFNDLEVGSHFTFPLPPVTPTVLKKDSETTATIVGTNTTVTLTLDGVVQLWVNGSSDAVTTRTHLWRKLPGEGETWTEMPPGLRAEDMSPYYHYTCIYSDGRLEEIRPTEGPDAVTRTPLTLEQRIDIFNAYIDGGDVWHRRDKTEAWQPVTGGLSAGAHGFLPAKDREYHVHWKDGRKARFVPADSASLVDGGS